MLVPGPLADEEYLRGSMGMASKLTLVQYLCDEVAQTTVFREHIDSLIDDLKALNVTRRTEKAEFKQQYDLCFLRACVCECGCCVC